MNPLRAITVAGVVGAATLASGLFADLFGVPGHVANGQTLMTRTPSVLAAPTGYASMPGYNSVPAYYSVPRYNPTPTYNAQPTPMPYGFAAYPESGYRPTYAQAAPYPYQPTSVQPSWPYVQSDDGQTSVLLGRSQLLGGPPLGPPQTQLPVPAPSHSVPHNQMPNNQMQPQMMPGYATPGYEMPGYPDGGAACDVSARGYASMNAQPAVRNWFGSVGGMVMTRDHGDHYTFSYGTGNEADQRTDTRNADMQWGGGFDVRLGRYFNCQRNAIEGVYWGLFPASQSTQTVSADVLGELNGILNWNSLDYDGNTVDVYVNVAPGDDGIHMLTRDYAFQNLELNLWQFCGRCGTGERNC